ncbi:hypothetical protein ACHAWO_009108 [Cyclotella atomus]|uniref:Uncharacterized protein n=1 Tax=Cyclotella atomus TaxID=382360 RepID=A0ABD3N5W7_9STRA
MKLPSLSLLLLTPYASVSAADSNNYNLQKVINQEPDSILESLSQYSKLYISVPKHSSHMLGNGYGNCVWSECGLDDQTDDMRMGDYRDGDGRWYRFRTQSFCANAAYSLYGVKKGEISGGGCNKKHFMNSFFTYDGADNLLKAVGVTPDRYYDYNGGGERRRLQGQDGGDDDGNQKEPVEHDYGNANCVQLDNYQANNNNNNNQEENEGMRRFLQSNDVNEGYSSSLGCDSKGNYIIAAFQGGNCNGNYFLDSIDSMDDYNDEFDNIGCHEIFSNSGSEDYTNEAIYTLLRDSWACDTKLYPHACPDPYGEKAIDEFALHSAAHGGNGILAYRNQKMQRGLNVLSFLFLIAAGCVSTVAYYLKNRGRIQKDGVRGTVGKDARGMFGRNKKKGDGEIEMKDNAGYKVPGGVVA